MKKFLAFLKAALGRLGKFVLALAVIFMAYAAYGIYADKSAASKVAEICSAVSSGDEGIGLREKAVSLGASERLTKWVKAGETESLFITFIGAPPFSRHVCYVEVKDGRVVSASLRYFD
jgi:hypothetical protein